jgi:hypothetical protein
MKKWYPQMNGKNFMEHPLIYVSQSKMDDVAG